MAEILYFWEQGYKIVKGRKRTISQKEYQEREEKVKTYAQYLEEAKSRPPSKYLAPVGAMPKISKGDSHKYRFKLEKMKRNKEVFKEKLPINRDGTINKAGLRRVRRGE